MTGGDVPGLGSEVCLGTLLHSRAGYGTCSFPLGAPTLNSAICSTLAGESDYQ